MVSPASTEETSAGPANAAISGTYELTTVRAAGLRCPSVQATPRATMAQCIAKKQCMQRGEGRVGGDYQTHSPSHMLESHERLLPLSSEAPAEPFANAQLPHAALSENVAMEGSGAPTRCVIRWLRPPGRMLPERD